MNPLHVHFFKGTDPKTAVFMFTCKQVAAPERGSKMQVQYENRREEYEVRHLDWQYDRTGPVMTLAVVVYLDHIATYSLDLVGTPGYR